MRMMYTNKSNIYRSMICRISQNSRNDRKIKTVKFLCCLVYILYGVYGPFEDILNLSSSCFGFRMLIFLPCASGKKLYSAYIGQSQSCNY